MSEDDAKKKWCPFVRLGGNLGSDAAGSTWNRWPGDKDPYDGSYCIGSSCMAWRTENYIDDNRMPDVRGYCGLAGKP